MNQILVTKFKKNNKKIFKIQLIFSIIIIIWIGGNYLQEQNKKKKLEEISVILNKNMELSQMYNAEKKSLEKSLYLGKIIIEKINLEYPIINDFNEELLKISPCKFYGGNIGEYWIF